MTNLVPVKRRDKNGVLTTKHVRAEPSTPVTYRSIPRPSIDTKPVITKARRPVYTDIMTAMGTQKMTVKDWENVKRNLFPLSDDELAEMHEIATQFSKDMPSVNWDFVKLGIRNGYALNAARTARAVCSDVEAAGFKDPHKTMGWVLSGAVASQVLGEDFSIPEGREDYAKTRVLATQAVIEWCDKYADSVSKSPIGTLTLKDYHLAHFIEENPSRGDDIVRAIQQRGTTDVGTIRELMDHDVKSLTEGVL